MNLNEFKKGQLKEKDLNDFKILLNDFYIKKSSAEDDVWVAKKELKRNEISKAEYKIIKEKANLLKLEYKKIASNKAFVVNLHSAKSLWKNNDLTDQDKKVIKQENDLAKFLVVEARHAIQERGRGAEMQKVNDIAVEVSKLSFKYAPEFPYALQNVNFKIKHGEYVTIIGHNGSGKSTLSKLLIGVYTAEVGNIRIFGNTMTKNNLDRLRSFLGIVFQNPDNQFIGSTVKADIAFGLENKRVDPKLMQGIIDQAAIKVGMIDFLDKEPLNLSGGQKQRVAIASALALNPNILIFDEATSMLDPKGKREIKDIMVDLRNQGDKTIISITHDMDEILNADKVIVMNAGELVRFGTPREVLADKKFLRSIHLDVPFVANVEESLEQFGVKVNPSKNMDELVKQLWKK